MPNPSIDDLRRYAVARSLSAQTTLPRALQRLGFVQADPIRSPARAQDLTLRHRVKGYRAGDLERHYPRLDIEEDFFVNYGFVTPGVQALLHPRTSRHAWTTERWGQAGEVWHFLQEHGAVHPKAVDAHFAHGHTTNGFGGRSKASTHLLDDMHYRGLLRVASRDNGTRLYAIRHPEPEQASAEATLDAMVDVLLALYAPLPTPGLRQLVGFLKHAAPQWQPLLNAAFRRARARLPQIAIDGVAWHWPESEDPCASKWRVTDRVRLLAPFDPVVWDRDRFERLWGWAYRFEAYTPAAKRVRGYYAMPLLWRDQVIGWGNLSATEGRLHAEMGYVKGEAPTDAGYAAALAHELGDMARFLTLPLGRVSGQQA
ncbi:cytoplasmic protein [Hydrogenophaga crassostreae]|uniref:Cytoplasmic protein n=1 Tax=Hydrogenophaga crassostreae TaxID=1763535 RepID=A0A162STX6_9BURK|nr:crosslink repair DNA glycosylase YcaQ family protein [Hydrogenophaga crassostreae]AOW15486.1 cytoplasmic protein [Hydrogenophaga crassostreae]OAD40274.1 cytoplasmic protein [Hydrogenophaga crassostreae]